MSDRATLTAGELAELAGCSTWAIYESVRAGDCPFPFVRVGKRILFVRSKAEEMLGLDPEGAQ